MRLLTLKPPLRIDTSYYVSLKLKPLKEHQDLKAADDHIEANHELNNPFPGNMTMTRKNNF